ncbi:GNAT family N-acetyltransferase [Kordiimonas lipolytica]|uniref:GNAT family N-acetyltransferase n=1 Tax=Kordiimonas lipolytica TaxID=1662421 RepID=A0ABV8UC09_9PROT|nr:GNAT family N-acetyltransferase [Kordiimonas lipolytica]
MTASLPNNARNGIRIVPYRPGYKQAFHDLNMAWLEKYFTVEPVHRHALENPESEIIEGGGEIFFAVRGDDVLGTVAIRADGGGVYELTKLGVDPSAQGLGLGRLLCEAVIDHFCVMGGTRLYLETHTKLVPAMRLYETLNFTLMDKPEDAHYQGTDCYMEWTGQQ